jgi:N-acetylneuraminate synthase
MVVGKGKPTYVIAEIGINHNGQIEIAKKLIDIASDAGCNVVKFQKRNIEKAIPAAQKEVLRETPWGIMTYYEYKKRIEFGKREFDEIDSYCCEKKIDWTASVWDIDSVNFIAPYDPPFIKIPSALLTNDELLYRVKSLKKPIIVSTGMSTLSQIDHVVEILKNSEFILLHCNSSYPAKNAELNLRVINTLERRYDCLVGYSGHEVGIQTSLAAVVLGACVIERHITVDRAMWGTDQAASLEPQGIQRLVRDTRIIEEAMGDGEKRIYDSELPIIKKLRG